ncbi:MAG: hypothetical protein IJ438_09330 [Clostridia bacterium]|nr:hypothetical protein [Clostridia bacterium]
MKARYLWLVFTVLLMLASPLLMPASALAADTIDSGFGFYIGPGETILPDYPDLSSQIGQGLTMDDFTVTYGHPTSTYTFDADGRITMSEGVTVPSTMTFEMTYTPKVQGVGKLTVFTGRIWVRKPLTEITVLTENVVLATDETAAARISLPSGAAPVVSISSYDSSVIDAVLEQESWNDRYWSIHITPKKVGETTVEIVAYNGVKASIPVKVMNPPSSLSFGAETFTCYVGDTVDLGMDLGGGGMASEPSISCYKTNSYTSYNAYFPDDFGHFYAKETGEFTIRMTTYNGHSATVQVNVYSKTNCASIEVRPSVVNVGDPYVYLYTYDADGNQIFAPLTITQGSDIASIGERKLATTAMGTVVVTSTNPDGSTVSLTIEVVDEPSQVFLNATSLTLDIGDTFDFEVTFDKGTSDYRLDVHYDDYFPPYSLFCVKLVDQHLVAQAPGTARVCVYAGSLQKECYITVRDSDAVVSLVTPEDPFGIGHTFQLSVVDRTGKTYPATYTYDVSAGDQAATVTEDGLVTGHLRGTTRIYATLEDGRVLRYDQEVKQVPTWIRHDSITSPINHTTVQLGSIESDVGLLYSSDVLVTVADKSIATFDGISFSFYKEGTTVVTLTAINGGAQTSFTLEVLPADDQLYAGSTSMSVPSGYSMYMPLVTDYYGNIVPVTWEMTYHVAGSGNPQSTGFILEGDVISCTWPYAYCEVTGTAENGARIKISVYGYRLATEIRFQQDEYTVQVGQNVQTDVTIVESGYELGPITWYVGDAEIISFTDALPQTGRPTATGLKAGVTTLRAVLINGASATCTITVEDPASGTRVPGDVNDDGTFDMRDALRMLRWLADWDVTINQTNANVNGDGATDMRDALRMLRKLAGWDVTLQ